MQESGRSVKELENISIRRARRKAEKDKSWGPDWEEMKNKNNNYKERYQYESNSG